MPSLFDLPASPDDDEEEENLALFASINLFFRLRICSIIFIVVLLIFSFLFSRDLYFLCNASLSREIAEMALRYILSLDASDLSSTCFGKNFRGLKMDDPPENALLPLPLRGAKIALPPTLSNGCNMGMLEDDIPFLRALWLPCSSRLTITEGCANRLGSCSILSYSCVGKAAIAFVMDRFLRLCFTMVLCWC